MDDQARFLQAEYFKRKEAEGLSASALKHIRHILRIFSEYLEQKGVESFQQVRPNDIRQFVLFLRAARTAAKRRYSDKYVYGIFRRVKRFLDFLLHQEVLSENPAEFIVVKPPENTLPKDILTEGEVAKLLAVMTSASLEDRRNRVIFELIYNTGLRGGETVNLNIYDLDFQESLIYVHKGKGGRNRLVPMNDYIRERLEEYVQHIRPEYRIANESYDALFVNARGWRLKRDNISDFIREYVRRTDISKRISAHSLRHTFATHLLKNGASIRYIQEILGHEFLSTTEIYTRVVPIDLKEMILRYHPRRNELAENFVFPDAEKLAWSYCHLNRVGKKYRKRKAPVENPPAVV